MLKLLVSYPGHSCPALREFYSVGRFKTIEEAIQKEDQILNTVFFDTGNNHAFYTAPCSTAIVDERDMLESDEVPIGLSFSIAFENNTFNNQYRDYYFGLGVEEN